MRTWLAIGIAIFSTGVANAQNLRTGTRYQLIDREVESVTTGFRDAEVTSVRMADGRVETRLRAGGKIVSTSVGTPRQVRVFPRGVPGGETREMYVDAEPLDAVNAAGYLSWKAGRFGKRVAEPASVIDFGGPVEIREAADDVIWVKSRTARMEAFSRIGAKFSPRGREMPAFTSVVRQDGEIMAALAWYSVDQTLVFQTKWRPEPLQVRAQDLPKGWTFRPNMAWANIQLISFVKSAEAHGLTAPVRIGRVRSLNTEGCDGLHWLDGLIFRQCCDIHDACYYKEDPVCGASSWWLQGSWSCVQCNIEALYCFASTTYVCAVYGCTLLVLFPGNPPPNCYAGYGDFCPAWCGCCDDGTPFGCP